MSNIDLLKYKNLLKVKHQDGKAYIFDPLRKKYLVLEPEEMVRQLFIQYLLNEKEVPKKHIAVERKLNIGEETYRFDLLVFNNKGQAKMIVECKSHKVKINEKTALQISKYNMAVKAEFLCLTNGIETYYYQIDLKKGSLMEVADFNRNIFS